MFDPVMVGHSKFRRYSEDAYFTIDAAMCVKALTDAIHLGLFVLEPCAGRGHLVFELAMRDHGVTARDLHAYEGVEPGVHITTGRDIMAIDTLTQFDAVVTNLPYDKQDEMLRHLLPIAHRDKCAVAILTRASWHLAKARRDLVHTDPFFRGIVTLPRRPWWSEDKRNSPRHDFVWCVWGASPRPPGAHPMISYPGTA